MNGNDEPILNYPNKNGEAENSADPDIGIRIRNLLDAQSFCVLCTQGESQPYGNLIASAHTEDLKHIFFCTPVTTRKFRLLNACPRVALVYDSRCDHAMDMTKIEAVTVTGRAEHLKSGSRFELGLKLLKERHIYLHEFLVSESTALFQVETVRYFHVTRFQGVTQWIP